jgi:sec-independent protein translocase protein TatA
MFGVGMPELLVILVIALLVLGTKRLPEVGSGLGKAIRGFKAAVEKTPPTTASPISAPLPCSHCNEAAPRDASFCPHCGATLRQGGPPGREEA